MELDSRKKSRRDRMMRSKSFDTQEVREIGRKEAGKSRGFPMEELVGNQNSGPEAPPRNRKRQERREQKRCQGRSDCQTNDGVG